MARNHTLDFGATQSLTDIVNSEFVRYGFFQEDVPEGVALDVWRARGGYAPSTGATSSGANRPTRASSNGGVKFTGGSTHYMGFTADTDAITASLWGLVIAKQDLTTTAGQDPIFYVNGFSGGAAYRQPFINFDGSNDTVVINYNDGSDRLITGTPSNTQFNLLFWMLRGDTLHGNLNGTWLTPYVGFKAMFYNSGVGCYIGKNYAAMTADMYVDCVINGMGEPTDEVAEKIIALGMARIGRTADLPSGNIFKTVTPILTDTDWGYKHVHDETTWQPFRSSSGQGNSATPSEARFASRGIAEPTRTGWSRTFYDDFTSNTLADSQSGDISSVWFAPAEIAPGNLQPSGDYACSRITDTTAYSQSGSDLRLRIRHNGSTWICSSFGSVNNRGQGRTWKAPMWRKVWFRLATDDTVFAGGVFPAPMWGYDRNYLRHRARNRIEFDDMECQANDTSFCNVTLWGGHPPTNGSAFLPAGVRTTPDDFEKLVGYNFNTTNGFPSNLDLFGNAGTTFAVSTCFDTDGKVYSYMQGRELMRETLPTEYANDEFSILVTAALRNGFSPSLNTAKTYDLFIEKIEVWEPDTKIASFDGAVYSARPTLSASSWASGQVITCTPNIKSTATNQVQYRWYRGDGSPIVGQISSTYTPGAAIASGVFCEVRAMGWINQPRALTATSPAIT